MIRAVALAAAGILAVFLLVVVFTPLTIGLGWYTGEAGLRSFGHVRQTYAFAYDHIEALDGLQSNACLASKLVETASPDVKAQRESQLLAVEQTYNRTEREYDAYMEDHFRGKIIRPGDLPRRAPALDMSACA